MIDFIFHLIDTLDDPCLVLRNDASIICKNRVAKTMFASAQSIGDILPQDGVDFFYAHREHGIHQKRYSAGSLWLTVADEFSVLRLRRSDVLPVGLFQKLTENLHPWLYVLEPNFNIVWANSPHTRAVIGRDFRTIVPKHLHTDLEARMARTRNGEPVDPSEVSAELRHGDRRWYRISWIPVVEAGELTHIGVFIQDITQPKEHDEALVRSEARYRTVLNNSLDIVALFSPDYRIQFITPNVFESLGYSANDVIGRSPAHLLSETDRRDVFAKLQLLKARPSQAVSFEVTMRRADGSLAAIEARVRVNEPGVDDAMLICNARDITARKELEAMRQQLIRADKLAAVGQLAAGVAHEINNPASYIYTNLFVLREYLAQFEDIYRDVQGRLSEPTHAIEADKVIYEEPDSGSIIDDMKHMIDVNIQGMDRISHIVRELRMFSRDDSGTIEHIDVRDTIDASVHLVRNQIDHIAHLEVQVDTDIGGIVSDRGKLSQVLINLLVNAAQAVADAPDNDNVVRVSCSQTPTDLQIAVSDTGLGMTPTVLNRIFEPFFTTKSAERGTGLGLWLCDEIVRKLGGRLDVTSVVGHGSTFTIVLPRTTHRHDSFEASLEEISDTEYALRVLVIDDDELVLESMRKLLQSHGHSPVIAQGGRDAIGLLANDAKFDAILCDVMMPSMDGLAFYEYLNQSHPELIKSVVFCTAGVLTQAARHFLNQPGIRVLHKPVSASQLHDVLRQMASRARKKAP